MGATSDLGSNLKGPRRPLEGRSDGGWWTWPQRGPSRFRGVWSMKIRVRLSMEIPFENGAWKLCPAIDLEEEVPLDRDYKEFYLELYQRANFMFWKNALCLLQMREQIKQQGLESSATEGLGKSL